MKCGKKRCGRRREKALLAVLLCVSLMWQSVFGVREGTEQALAAEKDFLFSLTASEEAYLQTLRKEPLTLAVAEPSAYQTGENTSLPWGMAVPLVELLECEFGLEIEVISGSWAEGRAALFTGKADMLFGILADTQTENTLELKGKKVWHSAAFYEEEIYLAVQDGKTLESIYQADGICVGIVGDAFFGDQLEPWLYFAKEQVSFDDAEALAEALANGKIEAAVLTESELAALFPYEELSVAGILTPQAAGATLGVMDEELIGLIELINRYLLETQEGDILREAMQAERLRGMVQYVAVSEQERLKYVKDRYAALSYTMLSEGSIPLLWEENGERRGMLVELVEFLADLTGIPAEYVDGLNDAEAVSLLEEGELVLVAGLAQSKESSEELVFSKALGMQGILPVISATEAKRVTEEISAGSTAKEQIAYCYWGVQADMFPFLSGTAFDGHTVVFGSEEELFEAFSEGTIGGMLLKEGVYEAQQKDIKAQLAEGISHMVPEQLAFYRGNEELNALLTKLIHMYEVTHPAAWERWQAAGAEWQQETVAGWQEKKETLLYIALGGCGVIIVLLLFGMLKNRRQERE